MTALAALLCFDVITVKKFFVETEQKLYPSVLITITFIAVIIAMLKGLLKKKAPRGALYGISQQVA
jgi:hypothetical protein